MRVHVLGAAAGGGFPQWNCNCPRCDGLRRGSIRATARTQSSIALSGDGENWLLVNASPDILSQLRAAPFLQPARSLRQCRPELKSVPSGPDSSPGVPRA